MTSPIDRTAKAALDTNLNNGITSDALKVKANNDVIYNYVDVLNSDMQNHTGASVLPHADGSVTTPKLADQSVSTAKIADYAVIGQKIASSTIDASKFIPGVLTNDTQNGIRITALESQVSQLGVNPKSSPYNAVGDGIANDTIAMQSAFDAAYAQGKTVWIPDGVFNIQGTLNLKTSIDGLGTLLFKNTITGKLNIPQGYDGITIKNITVDGNVVSTGGSPSYSAYIGNVGIINNANDVKIFNVTVRNTNGTGIGNYGGHRFTVAHCHVSGCRNVFGDGIYSQNAYDCKFLFNYVHDFTRIGIVCDGVSGKSKNPLILGNLIENAHDAGGGELNAGIWTENTLGGKIIENTTKVTSQRGILVVPLIDDAKVYHYLVEGNTIIDPIGNGISINAGSTNKTLANVDVRNNSILGTYNVGITTGIHCNTSIDQCYFGDSNVQSLILTDMNGFVEKVNITIRRCSKGSITYKSTTEKDINLFNQGLIDLTIQDMAGTWSYNMPASQITGTFRAFNTNFIFDNTSTTFLCNFLGGGGLFENCEIQIATSSSVSVNTPTIELRYCKFTSNNSTIRRLIFAFAAYDNSLYGCRFDKVNIWDLTQAAGQNFKYLLRNCEFSEYGVDGAINIRFDNTSSTFDVRVLECTFKDSGTNKPIKKGNYDITKLIVRNNISPTTSAVGTGLTITSETGTLLV